MDETIGDRIRKARSFRNLDQRALAERMGINDSNISRWESDKPQPRRSTSDKISAALDVNPDWLWTGEGEMIPPRSWTMADQVVGGVGEPINPKFSLETTTLRKLGADTPAHKILQNVLLDAAEQNLTSSQASQLTLAIQDALKKLKK